MEALRAKQAAALAAGEDEAGAEGGGGGGAVEEEDVNLPYRPRPVNPSYVKPKDVEDDGKDAEEDSDDSDFETRRRRRRRSNRSAAAAARVLIAHEVRKDVRRAEAAAAAAAAHGVAHGMGPGAVSGVGMLDHGGGVHVYDPLYDGGSGGYLADAHAQDVHALDEYMASGM